jgi:hypothetical protein
LAITNGILLLLLLPLVQELPPQQAVQVCHVARCNVVLTMFWRVLELQKTLRSMLR